MVNEMFPDVVEDGHITELLWSRSSILLMRMRQADCHLDRKNKKPDREVYCSR